MLYQGDKAAVAGLEDDEYWLAVSHRQTWHPEWRRYTRDDVCATIMFTFKDEGYHPDEYCGCAPHPGAVLQGHRWTHKDEEYWLRHGRLRPRPRIDNKHIEFARRRDYANQLIK